MLKKLLLTSLVFYLLVSCSKKKELAISVYQKSVFNSFLPKWQLYRYSSRGGWKNNDNGRFTHDDAPALLSLLELFKHTNDNRYLDTFNLVAENIINNDDRRRNLQDYYRMNRVLPGWSSTRYTHDKNRTIFIANDALILTALLKFNNQLKYKTIYTKYQCEKYIDISIESFNKVIEPCWVKLNEDNGYFQDSYFNFIGLHMPNNQISTIGLFCFELYKATNNFRYLEYATRCAKYLKSVLISEGNGYVWYYKQPTVNFPEIVYDDYSHAQLVFRFILEMAENRIVFSDNDINRLQNTFLEKIIDSGHVNFYFNGKINQNTSLPIQSRYAINPNLSYYYKLASYSNEVRDFLINFSKNKAIIFDSNSEFNHIGEFVLLDFAYSKMYLNLK
jgi:hypothetical protein